MPKTRSLSALGPARYLNYVKYYELGAPFVNYSVIDHELLNKIIYDVGKLQRAHPTLRGHFACGFLYHIWKIEYASVFHYKFTST